MAVQQAFSLYGEHGVPIAAGSMPGWGAVSNSPAKPFPPVLVSSGSSPLSGLSGSSTPTPPTLWLDARLGGKGNASDPSNTTGTASAQYLAGMPGNNAEQAAFSTTTSSSHSAQDCPPDASESAAALSSPQTDPSQQPAPIHAFSITPGDHTPTDSSRPAPWNASGSSFFQYPADGSFGFIVHGELDSTHPENDYQFPVTFAESVRVLVGTNHPGPDEMGIAPDGGPWPNPTMMIHSMASNFSIQGTPDPTTDMNRAMFSYNDIAGPDGGPNGSSSFLLQVAAPSDLVTGDSTASTTTTSTTTPSATDYTLYVYYSNPSTSSTSNLAATAPLLPWQSSMTPTGAPLQGADSSSNSPGLIASIEPAIEPIPEPESASSEWIEGGPALVATGPLPTRTAAPLGGVLATSDLVPLVDHRDAAAIDLALLDLMGSRQVEIDDETGLPIAGEYAVSTHDYGQGALASRDLGVFPLLGSSLNTFRRSPDAERLPTIADYEKSDSETLAADHKAQRIGAEPRTKDDQSETVGISRKFTALAGLTVAAAFTAGLILPEFSTGRFPGSRQWSRIRRFLRRLSPRS